ncbi:MAG: hypothetical protein C0601_02120 [Candidatus Muiribacterium halophilum]|uniref:Uncharacterized protein n=1 Tax=Muiribacterium halophilum TaxID=2053465 RepID=A0A2N5ZKW3_MUIH1|nr:MAG: hypothetical protein C0601_02120 [Candidatus Muirbacterium halophilum]
MKRLFAILIIMLFLITSYSDSYSGSMSFGGNQPVKKAKTSDVADVLRQNISGINANNKFEKVSEYLDSNQYLGEDVINDIKRNISLTPEGAENPVHKIIEQRIDKSFEMNTISRQLENVMRNLSASQQLRIRPNDNYSNLKQSIDTIDEQLRTGLRAGDRATLDSIAEFVALKSKGYTARFIAPIVQDARKHTGEDDGANGAINRLFDAFGNGLETINQMNEADDIVQEATTNLRADDNLDENMDIVQKRIIPLTSIGKDDPKVDEDGHPISDVIYYMRRMNREMPRAMNEAKKNHMNLMLDILEQQLSRNEGTLDNNGREPGAGGGDFLQKIQGFLQLANLIIQIISEIAMDTENPASGLSQFFSGLPAVSNATSLCNGSTCPGTTTSADATTTTADSTPATRPSGAGLSRIIQSANAAVGQSGRIHGILCYTATTEWGNLACSAVVSAILQHAGTFNEQELYCPTLEQKLQARGYDRTNYPSQSQFTPGDVVFWAHTRSERARHVGVITNKDVYNQWWGVDNSSSAREVRKRPTIRSYYPVVRSIFTYTR